MDGMPASSSTATPMGRRRREGQNSTKKTATPKATGSANSSARSDETRVPTIGPAAPTPPVTGFEVLRVKNPKRNLGNVGHPPIASETTMPASEASRAVAAAKQR